jgi:putative transcriptional regulator
MQRARKKTYPTTKRKQSAGLPSGLKKPRSERSLGEDIIAGLQELQAHMRGEIKLRTRVIEVPDPIDVRAIREKSGLTQTEFANRYGFSGRTLQQWEQGRQRPDGAVRAYLLVIDREPAAVQRALAG